MQQQMSFLDSQYGKTSQDPSAATEDVTSSPSSKRSAPSVTNTLMYLDLRTGAGNLLGAYWEMDTVLPGVSMMLNTGESPSVVKESTLSQILQANVPEKYCLSPRACRGILRRAEKRGKELPSMLKDALIEVAFSDGVTDLYEEDEIADDDAVEAEESEEDDEE